MQLKYFQNVTSESELSKQYRKLAKKMHPEVPVKKDTKNQQEFHKMLKLHYPLKNNKDAKLMVGVRKNNEHIKYCLSVSKNTNSVKKENGL